MDTATELALRTIIRSLCQSAAINSDQVQRICAALKDAAGAARDRSEADDAKALVSLAKGIKHDLAM